MILKSHAKLSIEAKHWFIAETHSHVKNCIFASNQVWPFVNIQADSVPGAMR
jgi:hypothetical protein